VRRTLVLLTILALAAPADALLCRARNGALSVRDACKRKETVIDPATLGGPGAQGDTGPAGPSTKRLRVVDANGTAVGVLAANGGLLLSSAGRVLMLDAGTDGFHPGDSLYYEAPGCIGPAYASGPIALLYRATVHGTVAYYPGTPIETRSIQSFTFPTAADGCTMPGDTYDGSTGLCCFVYATTSLFGPAIPVDLGGFAVPFRLEVDG
jgi:hypothetical protein